MPGRQMGHLLRGGRPSSIAAYGRIAAHLIYSAQAAAAVADVLGGNFVAINLCEQSQASAARARDKQSRPSCLRDRATLRRSGCAGEHLRYLVSPVPGWREHTSTVVKLNSLRRISFVPAFSCMPTDQLTHIVSRQLTTTARRQLAGRGRKRSDSKVMVRSITVGPASPRTHSHRPAGARAGCRSYLLPTLPLLKRTIHLCAGTANT